MSIQSVIADTNTKMDKAVEVAKEDVGLEVGGIYWAAKNIRSVPEP